MIMGGMMVVVVVEERTWGSVRGVMEKVGSGRSTIVLSARIVNSATRDVGGVRRSGMEWMSDTMVVRASTMITTTAMKVMAVMAGVEWY